MGKKMRQLRILSAEQITNIHQTSVRILGEIGVKIDAKEAVDILTGSGCTVADGRVYFPVSLIDKVTSLSGRPLLLHSRTGQTVRVRPDRSLVHNCGTVATVSEMAHGGKHREATLRDAADFTRLLDALDSIDAVVPMVYPQDVPQEVSLFYAVKEAIKHTTKPICGPGVSNLTEARYIHEMFLLLAGSAKNLRQNPMYDLGFSPLSPLTMPEKDTEAAIWAAKQGVPIGIIPCPITGMTAPFSLLGALTQQNSEMLAALVLFRLIDHDLPVSYGARLSRGDLRFGGTLGGLPETAVLGACAVQLADYYSMESNVYGADSGSNLADAQAGWEKAINTMLPAYIGSDWLSGAGAVNDGASVSYEQLVMDDEMFSMVFQLFGTLQDDDEDYGLQGIKDVVENDANFLTQESTIRHLRSPEQWMRPAYIGNIRGYTGWLEGGGQDSVTTAGARVAKLLAEQPSSSLDVAIEKEFDRIIDAASRELRRNRER